MLKRLLVFSLICLPLFVAAFTVPGRPSGFVNDFAGVLSASDRGSLEQKLSDYEKKTGNEISVVIIDSLAGDSIENYAVKLFEEWGIGKKGKDNGLLILVAVSDRKMRIEVGYGLEGQLPDSVTARIVDGVMKPAFKAGDFNSGLGQATDAVVTILGGGEVDLPVAESSANSKFDPFTIIFFVIMAIQVLVAMMARSKSWWLGGVFGAIVGGVVTFFFGLFYFGLVSFVILIPLGLLLDFVISRGYSRSKVAGGHIPWYFGGSGRGGSGGGFGGFGGGHSGGGGSSGSW